MAGVGGGGETLRLQLLFQGLAERLWVGFDAHHVVRTALKDQFLRRPVLGVQGVEHHAFAVQLQPVHQPLRGGDFVALVAHAHRPQPATGLPAKGADQLQPARVAQFFAVDGDQGVLHRAEPLVLPP